MSKLYEKISSDPNLSFLQNGIYPQKLYIVLKTNIEATPFIEYSTSMNITTSKLDYVLFNQLIPYDKRIINDNTSYPNDIIPETYRDNIPETLYKDTVPDNILQKFINKDRFIKYLDALVKGGQEIVSMKDSCKDDYISKNIRLTLDTLFHYNNSFRVNNKTYKVLNYNWGDGNWNVSTLTLSKNIFKNTLNPLLKSDDIEKNEKLFDSENKKLKEYFKNLDIKCIEGVPTKATGYLTDISNFVSNINIFAKKGKPSDTLDNVLSIYNESIYEYDKSVISENNKIITEYEKTFRVVYELFKNDNNFKKLVSGCNKPERFDISGFKNIYSLICPIINKVQSSSRKGGPDIYNIASNSIIGNILYPDNKLEVGINTKVNAAYNSLQEMGTQLKQSIIQNNKYIGYYMDNEMYDIITSELSSYEINATPSVRQATSSTLNAANLENIMKFNTYATETVDILKELIKDLKKTITNMDPKDKNIEYFLRLYRQTQLPDVKQSIESINSMVIYNNSIKRTADATKKSFTPVLYNGKKYDSANEKKYIREMKTILDIVKMNKSGVTSINVGSRYYTNDLTILLRTVSDLFNNLSTFIKYAPTISYSNISTKKIDVLNETNMFFLYYQLIFMLYKLANNKTSIDAEKYQKIKTNFVTICKNIIFNSLKIMFLQREYLKNLVILYESIYSVKKNESKRIDYRSKFNPTYDKQNENIENKIRINIVLQLFLFDINIYKSILESDLYQTEIDHIGEEMKQHVLQLEAIELENSKYNIKYIMDKTPSDYYTEMVLYTTYLYTIFYYNKYYQSRAWRLMSKKTNETLCSFTRYVSKSVRSYAKINNEYQSLYTKQIDTPANITPNIVVPSVIPDIEGNLTKTQYETRLRSVASVCYDLIKVYSFLNNITFYRSYYTELLYDKYNESYCQMNNYMFIVLFNISYDIADKNYKSQLLYTKEQSDFVKSGTVVSVEEWINFLELKKIKVDSESKRKIREDYIKKLDLVMPSLSTKSINKICLNILGKECNDNVYDVLDERMINEQNIFSYRNITFNNSPFLNKELSNIFSYPKNEENFTTKVFSYGETTEGISGWSTAVTNAIQWHYFMKRETIPDFLIDFISKISNITKEEDKIKLTRYLQLKNVNIIEINYSNLNESEQYYKMNVDERNELILTNDSSENIHSIRMENIDNLKYYDETVPDINDALGNIDINDDNNDITINENNLTQSKNLRNGSRRFHNTIPIIFHIYPRIFIDYTTFDILSMSHNIFVVKEKNKYYNIQFENESTNQIILMRNSFINIFLKIPHFKLYSESTLSEEDKITEKHNITSYNEYIDNASSNSLGRQSFWTTAIFNSFTNNMMTIHFNEPMLPNMVNNLKRLFYKTMIKISNNSIDCVNDNKNISNCEMFSILNSIDANNEPAFLDRLKKQQGIQIITIYTCIENYSRNFSSIMNTLNTRYRNIEPFDELLGVYKINKNELEMTYYNDSTNQYESQKYNNVKINNDYLFEVTNKGSKYIIPNTFIDYENINMKDLKKVMFVVKQFNITDLLSGNNNNTTSLAYLYVKNKNKYIVNDYNNPEEKSIIDKYIFNKIPYFNKNFYFKEYNFSARNFDNEKSRYVAQYTLTSEENANLKYYFENFGNIRDSDTFVYSFLKNRNIMNTTIQDGFHTDLKIETDTSNVTYRGGNKGIVGGKSDDFVYKLKDNLALKMNKFIGKPALPIQNIKLKDIKTTNNDLCYVIQVEVDLHEGPDNITQKEKEKLDCKKNHDKIVSAWKLLTNQSSTSSNVKTPTPIPVLKK